MVGGLVGRASGASGATIGSSIAASYAAVTVTANSTSTRDPALFPDTIGGLVGTFAGTPTRPGSLTASYATGAVAANRTGATVGGLIGFTGVVTVTASYATGTVTGSSTPTRGLIDYIHATATVTASYWDTGQSSIPDDSGAAPPEGKTTANLQSPTGYTGIYAGWNVDVDNADGDRNVATGTDDPWDFGTNAQRPVLKYNGYDLIRQGRAASLIVSPAALSVAEGAGADYTVALNGQPQAAVTVAITSNNAAVTINAGGDTFGSSTTLSFSTLNWNVPQPVTVKAANDADLADGAATLSHVAAGAGSGFESASQSLPVTITDTTAAADTELPPIIYNLNIRFDARRIALPEGHQATYRVRLAGQPAGRGSNIRIRSDNPDVQPTPDALLFTAANWNQWQTVAISIAGDANHTDESATLARYGPNRGYGSVLVSVTDTGDSRQAGDTPPPALTVVTEPGALGRNRNANRAGRFGGGRRGTGIVGLSRAAHGNGLQPGPQRRRAGHRQHRRAGGRAGLGPDRLPAGGPGPGGGGRGTPANAAALR